MKITLPVLLLGGLLHLGLRTQAQPTLATGGQKPMAAAEWIDESTGHRIVRLSGLSGENESFYFHNNPFLKKTGREGDKMVYYHKTSQGKQLYVVNLKTRQSEPLTRAFDTVSGEIVAPKRREVFYQTGDSVYATHVDTKKTRLIFVFPADFKATITTLNADETLLGGAWATDEEKEITKKYPAKSDFFDRIYEAKLPRTLFTVNVQNGQLDKIFTDKAWLNHVQFSPTNPQLLMFCHEGPWHKVDRIWTIDIKSKDVKLVHKRTIDMEIAGHEFFSPDGKTIWYDQQLPRGETFYVTGTDLKNGYERKCQLERNEWSVHYTISPSQRLFAGDGGDETSVAKAPDGKWIYLLRPQGLKFTAEKLVNMKKHDYDLEPNVHFSPDEKWIIFRANFEGKSQIYAVEVAKATM
ncbi:oligogalacturonate lyase family protein [Hymenobacter sp.]|jgi:oligogalacturonide lyase|uniref:oligogalacturonate lyase family protein n=1 Tax=Hymenobacter sp. TaxID=1898978 RepID=UPI002ED78606